MVDLSVKFAGVEFRNPVMMASIAPCAPWSQWPPEKDAPELQMKLWRHFYEGEIGALVTGTMLPIDVKDGRGGGRFWASQTKGFGKREGLVSCATIPDALWSRTNGLELIRRAKKEFTDTRIIASIIADGIDPKVWGGLALDCERAGADMVEVNCACEMFVDEYALASEGIQLKEKLPPGITMGLVPQIAASIIKGMKGMTKLPLIIKLTPEMSFFHLMQAIPLYLDAGVDAVTSGHTFMTVVPPDIYNHGKTTFPGMNTTTWWGTNGPWHRFACYRNIAMIGKYFPQMPSIACGGLVTPEQCVEVIMLGATGVQLSAGIWWSGLSFVGKVVKFMKGYMKEQGYKSMKEIIGLGQKYIVEMNECQQELKPQIGKLIAHVDNEKCVGLAKCNVCLDNYCVAVKEEGDYPVVDATLCSSCNLCVIRCPHGARSLHWIGK